MVISIAITYLKFKILSLILVIISTINSFLIKSNYFNTILVFLVYFIHFRTITINTIYFKDFRTIDRSQSLKLAKVL